MKKGLEKWSEVLKSAFPRSVHPYWRAMPMNRMTKLLTACFLFSAAMGFVADLLQIKLPALAHGFFWPVWIGVIGLGIFLAQIKRTQWSLLLLPVLILGGLLAYSKLRTAGTSSIPDQVFRRVIFDSFAIWAAVAVAFRVLLSFVSSEGLAYVRMQTELSLAHQIQQTLVPTLSIESGRFEVYGRSLPSKEMGGDVIDAVQREGGFLAYIADISGHGLAAGQLMGMLKAAMRMALQFHGAPASLFESADRVLPAMKSPNMYATAALLSFDNSMEAEYCLAGHPAILHYRALTGDAARLSIEQLPLGLIPGSRYASARVAYAPADVFLMLTDGIPDTVSDNDEEFGLDRVEQILIEHAAESLSQIWDAVIGAARRHGTPEDDQTILLLRVRESLTPDSTRNWLV